MEQPVILGVIAREGNLVTGFTLPVDNKKNAVQGYNNDVFGECDPNTPIVDWRLARPHAVQTFASKYAQAIEIDPENGTLSLAEYLQMAELHGANVYTVKDLNQ